MIGRICILPLFRTTRNTKLQNFQFKLSHRITATNSFLFKCGLKETELCTFCTETNESLLHLFQECTYSKKKNWFSLVNVLKNCSLNMQQVYLIHHYVKKFVSDLRLISVFFLGTPVCSTNKTDRQDITEILLKVVLNTITLTPLFHDESGMV